MPLTHVLPASRHANAWQPVIPVRVSVDGADPSDVPFLLDSGASWSAIPSRLLVPLGASWHELEPTESGRGMGGGDVAFRLLPGFLEFAGHRFAEPIRVYDDRKRLTFALLGCDFLAAFRVGLQLFGDEPIVTVQAAVALPGEPDGINLILTPSAAAAQDATSRAALPAPNRAARRRKQKQLAAVTPRS